MSRWGYDPHVTHLFVIELDGFEVAHFAEVSGLSAQNEQFEIKEGGENSLVHKFVTRCSFGDITLKRGYVNNPLLFYWFETSQYASKTFRMNGSIVMLARNGLELCRFNFYRAFPVKWEGPTFNAGQSAPAMHSLTIAVEKLELLFPGEEPNPPEPPPPQPPPPPPPPPPSTLEGITFDVNKSEIKPNPNPALDAWAEHAKENPTTPLFVSGHTSTTGSASRNRTLSQERADATAQYLRNKGVTNPITATGYAYDHLKVPDPPGTTVPPGHENTTNRRIEINENTNPYG